jgi:NTP pyrophosphatase (non-canonical NTP hydrolase)
MELGEYVENTMVTAVYPGAGEGNEQELAYLALGLAGETGEAVDCIKKIFRDPDNEARVLVLKDKLFYELGDVMWYWARLCSATGVDPGHVLEMNYQKLLSRLDQGTLKHRRE